MQLAKQFQSRERNNLKPIFGTGSKVLKHLNLWSIKMLYLYFVLCFTFSSTFSFGRSAFLSHLTDPLFTRGRNGNLYLVPNPIIHGITDSHGHRKIRLFLADNTHIPQHPTGQPPSLSSTCSLSQMIIAHC